VWGWRGRLQPVTKLIKKKKKQHTMLAHLFVKQPQRCNGQRVHRSLGRTWARFQIPDRVKPDTQKMIFISSTDNRGS
jgi:hypothetical protein